MRFPFCLAIFVCPFVNAALSLHTDDAHANPVSRSAYDDDSQDALLIAQASVGSETTEWRRTQDGWERADHVMAYRPTAGRRTAASQLHPLVVGSFLFLASIGLLLLFEEDREDGFFLRED